MSLWSGLGSIVRRAGQSVDYLGRTLQGSYAIVDKGMNFLREVSGSRFLGPK